MRMLIDIFKTKATHDDDDDESWSQLPQNHDKYQQKATTNDESG